MNIQNYLPHRFPFLLIDKIIDIKKGEMITAQKNVSNNEPFFQGHFPGQPVMPGVLSLEIMAQAGSFLMLSQVEDPLSTNMFFTTVEKAKFRKPVVPGDVMLLAISVQKMRNKLWKFKGEVIVDSQRVSECEFSAMMGV